MRILVDVGAHYGETLDVALDPRWGFDRIYSLEPASACRAILRGFRDRRLRVFDHGLSNRTQQLTLFAAGSLGASVYADKLQYDARAADLTETIQVVRASEWLERYTDATDDVFLKLNCEGSEVDVLADLIQSGVVARLNGLYVDFDVRKIPSQAHRQREVEEQLTRCGVTYATPASVGAAGNPGVERWLRDVVRQVPVGVAARLRHKLRLYRPPYLLAKSMATHILPRPLLTPVVRHLGRHARARRS